MSNEPKEITFQVDQMNYIAPNLPSLQPIVDFITASPVPQGMSYNDIHGLITNLTNFAEMAVFNFNKLRAIHGEEPWTADEIRAMGVPVVDNITEE